MTRSLRVTLLAAACCAGAAGARPAAHPIAHPAAPPPAAPPAATPAPAYGVPPTVASPSVRAGIDAWQGGNFPLAIGNWRPLADRGDADAQYNLAQAYFLGRGVPQNANLAEQWYERAARQGHQEAQANYGLLLFQNGRRQEAMPWIEQAANRGDPRAQYVLGTALFNGDLVTQDLPRAYALMSRAAATGLPPAVNQLAAMQPHITAVDRARGEQLAAALPAPHAPTQIASATAPHPPVTHTPAPTPTPHAPPPRPTRAPVQTATATPVPPPHPRQPQPPTPAQAHPAQVRTPAPTPTPTAAGGHWRVQLGAFSNEANARHAWAGYSGRLSGAQPAIVHAGAVYRLQAGPYPSRAAAAAACARAGNGCFPVAP